MGLKDKNQYKNFVKCSVTSVVKVLRDVKWYIITAAQGLLQEQVLRDVKWYIIPAAQGLL